MIYAEIKSKISFPGTEESNIRELDRMEDLLTSNVFGVLKNLDASCWSSLLPEEVLEDFGKSERNVDFWNRYSHDSAVSDLPNEIRLTEPDVILETTKYLVFIEVKYFCSFVKSTVRGEHQLKREWTLGNAVANSKGKEFSLISLTPFSPSIEQEIQAVIKDQDILSRVHIRYWEDVYQTFSMIFWLRLITCHICD
ncbi:hypothetical protein ES705_05507 [subsurface metagenome]